jgi:hypothetical protein
MFFATVAVIAGMIEVIRSGESYSDNFSTVFCVGRTAKLSVQNLKENGSGCDPLPAHLKHARVEICAEPVTSEAHKITETPRGNQSLLLPSTDPLHRSQSTRTV